ncbi:chorismate mutase [Archangium sp.]|uniref:chorismate mutase n=1 Tax=Archangium sp. TaxID=1872627 RepID=UPI002D7718AF|nr:chorismate mutase [Archangium sp.]
MSPADTPLPARPRDSTRLQELRRNIDAIDQRLVQLLNERASLVVEVGKAKRADGTPIYAPHREAEHPRQLPALAPHPLSSSAYSRPCISRGTSMAR